MENNNMQDELTLKEIIIQIIAWIKYIFSKWYYILICVGIGLGIGFLVSKFSKVKFNAESNFVLEGINGSGSDGLGSALGFGVESSPGLFNSIDNIIWLYQSDELLTQTFLSQVTTGESKGELLINLFTRTSRTLRTEIDKRPQYKDMYFNENDTTDFGSIQVTYLRLCLSILKTENLKVDKVEKTDNIVNVKVEADNEDFAYSFNKHLVSRVNQFYIESKTKKHKENVENLQLKVDTLKTAVDKNMYEVAQSADLNPFPNPHLKVLNVEPQKQNIDVQVLSNLYIQATQNLEVAKNELAKETPIIQLVDEPLLPLPGSKFGLKTGLLYGGVLGFILALVFFIFRKIYTDAMEYKSNKKQLVS